MLVVEALAVVIVVVQGVVLVLAVTVLVVIPPRSSLQYREPVVVIPWLLRKCRADAIER